MGAYTYVGSGTVAFGNAPTNLTPGTHASTAVGNLLILWTMNRAAATLTSITGWTQLLGYSNSASVECWARIATGSDSATVTWSGTSKQVAWIETYSGNVYTDLSTIVAHSGTSNNSSTATSPITSALTITTNDCLLLLGSLHKNTTSPAGLTVVAPTGTTLTASRVDTTASAGYEVGGAYVQQTTATNWDGSDFTLSGGTSDSAGSTGIMLALKSATALTKKLKLLANSSAASATGVAGVVFSAPTGTNITGTTRYGEFTGKTFESALESGKAVLKVPVADFGGTALTTASTPVALVRNTINTTGIVSCTVIEE